MKDILLNILATFAILSSILVITSKNPVISVLYLISVFINTAGYLILLGIGFIGIAYILVYIGAITVLFLFVIMMINIKLVDILEVGKDYTKNLPLALLVGFIFLYIILSISTFTTNDISITSNPISLKFITYPLEILTDINKIFISNTLTSGINLEIITNNFISNISSLIHPMNFDGNFVNFLQVEMLGQGLYTYGAVWLILSSIILLLAIISPILLSSPNNNPKL